MGHGDCPVELRDSVGRLAKRLKVSLPEKELEAAPQFVSLLDRLSEVVGPSGAAVESQRKLDMKVEDVESSRLKYLKSAVKLQGLEECISDYQLCELEDSPPSDEDRSVISRIKENLLLGYLATNLLIGRSGNDEVVPLLEESLFNKCCSLLLVLDSAFDKHTSKAETHLETLRLPDRISELQYKSKGFQESQQQMTSERREEYTKQLVVVEKVIEILSTLVREYHAEATYKKNEADAMAVAAKCHLLGLKVEGLEKELMSSMYTPDSVAALKEIRTSLLNNIQKAREETQILKSKLEQYDAAGPEHSELVARYASLCDEIKGKKWALREIGGYQVP